MKIYFRFYLTNGEIHDSPIYDRDGLDALTLGQLIGQKKNPSWYDEDGAVQGLNFDHVIRFEIVPLPDPE